MVDVVCCVLAPKKHVKTVKCAVERTGIQNKKYRITKVDDDVFAIPVHPKHEEEEECDVVKTVVDVLSLPLNIYHVKKVEFIEKTKLLEQKFSTPLQQFNDFLLSFIASLSLDDRKKEILLAEIPTKWETHEDLILFPIASFQSDVWKKQPLDFWLNVAKVLRARRIGLVSHVTNDELRTPQVAMLLGTDSWVTQTDNGIVYSYDVMKTMFSKGNITEKLRISKFDCSDETVVDLFAGIGYFTLPFLLKAKAKKVIACEWNPDAVTALTRNLRINNILDKCEVRLGDNRKVAPKNIADRVNLGLIPTSSMSWHVACDALKQNTGGWLHIHENVESSRQRKSTSEIISDDLNCICGEECLINVTYARSLTDFKRISWCIFSKRLLHKLEIMLKGDWNVFLRHIEKIKSYAPHVDHLVFDVECRPSKSQ